MFPDSNKKYISTDLMRDEPVRHGFLSADVKLLRYRVFPRRCEFCPPAVRNQRPTEHTTDVAHTIIDLERRALERWGNGDPSGFLEICADDVVYFDPYQARRLNGIDELRALYESIRGQVSVARFELVDPRVQAVDDMAVLTFNYVAQGTNEATSRWNCTEVYRRRAGSWKIIQTHWSFTQPGGIGA